MQMNGLRDAAVRTSKALIRSELLRKRAVVTYYNAAAAITRLRNGHDRVPSILDVDGIAIGDTFGLDEEYRGNCLYGVARSLKEYASVSGKVRACIEHGVYFGDYVNVEESVRSGLPAVITFSDVRRTHIRSVSPKTTFSIGPYICYAHDHVGGERAAQLRSELGKTLLVFPSHSHDRESTHFDSSALVDEVERFRSAGSFDSVICCLYYWDLRLGRAELYEDTDFLLATAGHRYDPRFLGRLRTLIGLSDHTLSNSVGTHIGYSVALGRPHTLICQDVHWGQERSPVPRLSGSAGTRQAEIAEVREAFCGPSDAITDQQRLVCERYWGLDQLRSPEELRFILDTCGAVFECTGGREALFDEAFRGMLVSVACPAHLAILRESVHHA